MVLFNSNSNSSGQVWWFEPNMSQIYLKIKLELHFCGIMYFVINFNNGWPPRILIIKLWTITDS